jgi:hypothetical protein
MMILVEHLSSRHSVHLHLLSPHNAVSMIDSSLLTHTFSPLVCC